MQNDEQKPLWESENEEVKKVKQENFWRRKAKNEATRKERMRFYPYILIFNSFAIYVSVSILLLYLHEFIGAFFAYQQGIPVKLFYHYFTYEKGLAVWNRPSVILTYGFPPFFFLLTGLVIGYLYFTLEHTKIPFRLVFIWATIVIFNIFFANLMYSFFLYKGLAIATEWFYVSRLIFIPLMIIGVVLSIALGKMASLPFMKMAPSVKLEVHKKPRPFLLRVAVIPYLLGALFLNYAYVKADLSDILVQFCVGLSVFGAWAFAKPTKDMKLIKNVKTNTISLTIISLFVFSVAFMFYATYNPFSMIPTKKKQLNF